ncbi:MAG: glutathione S-transferase family protein [Pseudomonadota bacterium]
MITIYGRATSSNVQLPMWAIGELGLEHERLDYGHKYGGTDTPEYRAMHPLGRVPVMRETFDDGRADLVMFESGAIARYLCEKYGQAPFWPERLEDRARLDVWCELVKATIAPMWAQPIFWSLLKFPAGEGGDTVQAAAEAIKPHMAALDARIADGPWLAGGDFTFADLWTGHLLYRYNVLTFDKIATPSLDAYYQRLTLRPAFAEHVMVSFEPLRMT